MLHGVYGVLLLKPLLFLFLVVIARIVECEVNENKLKTI